MNEVIDAVKKHITNSFSALNPQSFSQEPAYVAALMGRLVGTAWENDEGAFVKIKTTVVNDHGPSAAEKKYGADFAITLLLNGPETDVAKAVLGQGKRGPIEKLGKDKKKDLDDQCSKMLKHTNDYLLLETPLTSGGVPTIKLSNSNEVTPSGKSIPLQDYVIEHLIACNHGDRREDFVFAVQDSSLERLEITVAGLEPDLRPRPSQGHKPRG